MPEMRPAAIKKSEPLPPSLLGGAGGEAAAPKGDGGEGASCPGSAEEKRAMPGQGRPAAGCKEEPAAGRAAAAVTPAAS